MADPKPAAPVGAAFLGNAWTIAGRSEVTCVD